MMINLKDKKPLRIPSKVMNLEQEKEMVQQAVTTTVMGEMMGP